MIYRKLYFIVLVRVLGILANSLLLGFVWFYYRDFLVIINLLVVLALQTFFLIRKLNQINHDFENFFKAVRNNDSTIKFQARKRPDFAELYAQFDLINNDIREIKIENENRNQYFKVLVEHVGVGLLSFDEKGKVSLFNKAAKELFNKVHMFRVQELDRIQNGLSNLILNLEPAEQKLISLYRNHEIVQLSVKATDLKMVDSKIKLVSFQNIKNELDEKELDSWQKLIRVLTHEIMNSVSPVNSSIATLIDLFTDENNGSPVKPAALDSEMISDVVTGLDIIDERTKGMIDFVNRFRDLTLLPKPNFKTLDLSKRIQNLLKLMAEKLTSEEINVSIIHPNETIHVNADSGMLDQILINLMNNSIHALEQREEKKIEIRIGKNEQGRAFVKLEDNGCGIDEELQSEVFIPFFTTKKSGSGVGLSLSRQLMRIHGGTLTFKSEPKVYTQFTIQF